MIDHLKMARKRGRALMKNRAKDKFTKLANAWDEVLPLRAGDQADRGGKKSGMHKNQHLLGSSLRVGWQGVGKRSAYRHGIGDTTHALDSLASLAYIADDAQSSAFSSRLDRALELASPGLVIHRHHDATPRLVKFASLQAQWFEQAKYLIKDNGRWQAIPWAEYRYGSYQDLGRGR